MVRGGWRVGGRLPPSPHRVTLSPAQWLYNETPFGCKIVEKFSPTCANYDLLPIMKRSIVHGDCSSISSASSAFLAMALPVLDTENTCGIYAAKCLHHVATFFSFLFCFTFLFYFFFVLWQFSVLHGYYFEIAIEVDFK